jgi:Flp pilus assembly protein TadG
MRPAFVRLARDTRASSAAEFALVLPLLIIFLLGMIDVGRLMWTWNEAEKATQMGVRYAVATDMVPTGLQNYSFVVSDILTQGDTIPTSSFGSVTCTSTSCTCAGSNCPAAWTTSPNTTAFNAIVARMQRFLPELTASGVQVSYANSGLGYAGDPNGSDVSPLVTVSIRPNTVTFRPITFALFRTTMNLPSFSAALTLEDGQGTVSN